MQLYEYNAHELRDLITKKEVSVAEVAEAARQRAHAVQPIINGFVTILETDDALRHAQQSGALGGLPIALKDNICTKDIATTCASKMLETFVPPYDATVSEKLKQAGMTLVGKCNMDEFAMGSTTETSYFGPTYNPHNLSRIPGGSSGGSAAVVASGAAVMALGTDTGGSVRQPSAHCGVVGMKPTYGIVSRYGVVAFASSLDQVGPIARNVQDCAWMMDAIVGHDERDSTSRKECPSGFEAALSGDIKGKRIGLPDEYFNVGVQDEVKEAVLLAAKKMEALGAIVEPCSLKLLEYSLPTYYLLSSAEASSNLARFDGVKYGYRAQGDYDYEQMLIQTRNEGFGDEVKRRIMLGSYVLSAGYYDAYYKKAQQARAMIIEDFNKEFDRFDVLLTPASPRTAWKVGEKGMTTDEIYSADICTVSVNIAGLPALVLPCGKDTEGLPIGMQLIGKQLDDALLLNVGHAYEQAANLGMNRPVLREVDAV
ncbi:Asp-tRNA(Asn)/Glu-tRNA(Gln) amidotransferase subunit GatA [Eubacteriales bacterium OttesenSCG-928-N14]|nr:Asp-tRNA(Asn)/Glu-tRNA(Gln) amidotransferase subunit GatA [Eubacteriales bacterium OttesenSCG-928-N14]